MGLTLNGRKVLDRTLLRGQEFILDADEDSSLTADTDDQLDLRLGGNDVFVFKTSELDISGVNIVNCGDIALDSISDDDSTGINIAMMDASATALTIQEAANAYLTFDTSNGTENIILGKKLTGGAVEIEGSAFDINGGTIGGVTLDGAIACGDQGMTGVGDMTFTAGSILAAAAANTSTLLVKGGGLAGTTVITVTSLDAGDTLGLANVNSFVAVGNLNIGAHDFTAATLIGANVTSGADPGHTHTGASLSGIDISADTNLAVTAPIVLTDDTLSHSAANGYVHIPATGASAQILQYSSAGTAKWVTLSSDVTIADGGAMTVADDSHAHVYSNIDETTSANWIGRVSDETGTGAWVFANTPTLVTPEIGVATGTSLDLGGTTLLASRALTVDTGGVFNIVLAAAAGDDFTVDTDKLVVEGDTGNVGIGTPGPGHKLHVYAGASGQATPDANSPVIIEDNTHTFINTLSPDASYSGLYMGSASDNLGALVQWNYDANLMEVGTHRAGGELALKTASGTEQVRIDSSGNVGIGTTGPGSYGATALVVYTSGSGGVTFATGDTTAENNLYFADGTTGNDQYRGVIRYDHNINAMSLWSNAVQRLTIDTNGNVGIGTTTPASLLDATGGLTTTGSVFTLGTKETTVVANDVLGRINFYAPLEASGTDAILPSASIVAMAEAEFTASVNSTSLHFQTGASETATTKMTVMSSGNVGIGTATPARQFHVHKAVTTQVDGLHITNSTTGATSTDGFTIGIDSGEAAFLWNRESTHMAFATGGTERIRIESGGEVGIGTQNPGQALDVNQGSGNMIADGYDTHSERRFKKNIIELTTGDYATIFGQLDTLKLYRYQLKHDHKGRQHLGMLADDPATPSILKGASDKYQSLSLGDIIMFLVATVKGLNHRVKTLEGGI